MVRTQRFALELVACLIAAAAASFSGVTEAQANCSPPCKAPKVCRYAAESGKFYCAEPVVLPKLAPTALMSIAPALVCSAATEPVNQSTAGADDQSAEVADDEASAEDDADVCSVSEAL